MKQRPWSEPGAGSALVFAVLFWLGTLAVLAVMFSPNLFSAMSDKEVIYLGAAGVVALIGALLSTRRYQAALRAKRASASEQRETTK